MTPRPNENERKRKKTPEPLPAETDVSLSDIARNAWTATLDDDEALDAVLIAAQGNRHLSADLALYGARRLVETAKSDVRASLVRDSVTLHTTAHPAQQMNAGLKRFSAAVEGRAKLFDWPLPASDVRLGDATVADLEAAEAYHAARAGRELARARLYSAVKAALAKSGKRTVREGVSERVITQILAQNGDKQ